MVSFMDALSGRGSPSPKIGQLRRMVLAYPSSREAREAFGPAAESRALAGQTEAIGTGYKEAVRRATERAQGLRLGPAGAMEVEKEASFAKARDVAGAVRAAKERVAFGGADLKRQILQSLSDLHTLRYMASLRKFEAMQAGAQHAVSSAIQTVGIARGIGAGAGG